MAEAYLELSVGAVVDQVVNYLGESAESPVALEYTKAGYLRFLTALDPRVMRTHVFSFLQPIAHLSVPATISGTATGVYDAGDDETTITATTEIFGWGLEGETITVAGAATSPMTIAEVTSTTVLVATGGEDFAGAAVTCDHPGIVAMPADFGGMVEPFTYVYDGTYTRPIIKEVSPEEIFANWRDSNDQDTTWKYAIVAGSYAVTASQAYYAVFSPKSEYARTLKYRYRKLPLDVVYDKTQYFLGGRHHSRTILELALAEAEIRTGHNEGVHEQRAKEMLMASIDLDKHLFTSTAPEYLGAR